MNRLYRSVAILALLAAFAADAAAQPQRDARPATAVARGAIVGVVTTDEGSPRPLRRARVTVTGGGLPAPRTVIAGDNGAFTIDRLPDGRFNVTAAREGYITTAYGSIRSGRPGRQVQIAGGQPATIAIRLPRGGVITGTVLDVDGQPAQGVNVSVQQRRFNPSPVVDYTYALAGTPAQAVTDDRGTYRIFGLPAGDYIVAASPRVAMGPPGASGVLVQMMSRGTLVPRSMLFSQTFHPGTTDLARAARVSVHAGEERSGIDIPLEYVPLARISGTVSGAAGFAPARVALVRTDEQTRPPGGPIAPTDPSGRFEFAAVPPGQYRLTARAIPPGQVPATRVNSATAAQYATADLTVSGEDVELTLALQPAFSIAGRIVFDSAEPPVADMLPVQLRLNIPSMAGVNGAWPLPPLVIDGTTFRLDGVVPGSYRPFGNLQGIRSPIGKWWLTSLVVGGRDVLDAPLELVSGTEDAIATLSDRSSEVSGVVTSEQAAPVPQATVLVFPADRRFWFYNSRRIAGVLTGPAGQYALRNLPPGDYRVAAATDIDRNDWFDPEVLDRLLATGTPFKISGPEKLTIDLSVR